METRVQKDRRSNHVLLASIIVVWGAISFGLIDWYCWKKLSAKLDVKKKKEEKAE
jgi:hypothetical protein